MKQTLRLAALAVAVFAALPLAAHEVEYRAILTGPSESPPNGSLGMGEAELEIDLDTAMMRVYLDFSGLSGTTTIAHVHCCTAVPGQGTSIPATITPSFPNFPTGVTSGSYDMTFDLSLASSYNPAFITANGGTVSGALNAFLAGLEGGSAYFNIHTTEFPTGEIRGFLAPVTAPVPEPETYALMLGGLAALGAVARRRKLH